MRTKEDIREQYRNERGKIPPSRRDGAKQIANSYLKAWLEEHLLSHPTEKRKLLSFAPLDEEIDIWPFNELVAKKGLLALPRVSKETLIPYAINDLEQNLTQGAYSILEPIKTCKAVKIEDLFAILVPGLAFDDQMHRLGFGKGYYDRFLASLPDIPRIGVGYREQLYPGAFPLSEHDIPLTHRFLF